MIDAQRNAGEVARRAAARKGWRAALGAPLLFLALLAAGLWNLSSPGPWWDEGWTLTVARTYVERGHYGRLLEGQPAPAGLEAAPAVTLPVAALFRALGVGLWQGRLFGVLCTAAALAFTWLLAARLYDRQVAWGTIAALLLLPGHPQLNPLLLGRQVLGEMPLLLWLVAGYACMLAALRRSPLWVAGAAAMWGLALQTKTQPELFLAVSLAAGAAVSLALGRRRSAALFAVALGGVYLARGVIGYLLWGQLAGHTLAGQQLTGLVEVMAFVPQAFNRLYALQVLLMFGLPTAGALAWALWREVLALRRGEAGSPEVAVLRWALLALAGSWLAWYTLLSVGVPRYLFPAAYVGAIFLAALLRDLTGGFDLRATLERMAAPLRGGRRTHNAGVPGGAADGYDERPTPGWSLALVVGRWSFGASAGAWLAALIVAAALPLTLLSYQRYYLSSSDRSAQRVAALLNERAGPGELIETYESELHFFLDRPYHYPPDQVHVALNRRSLLQQDALVSYDPLAADPDYLVVGQFARGNRLYQPALERGAFELLLRDGAYEVYRRVRR
ncbi:MAG TPA: glycosyltransferase family 39 protein [Roseiflexaceae bacterium]|nr:glycosyltransferase family 39 protein [Roseiflexaceae bacterium]